MDKPKLNFRFHNPNSEENFVRMLISVCMEMCKVKADEAIFGTKVKKRKQFLQMIADAETGLFDHIVVKDISRFARNTVDFLQNIRTLKQLGIETEFLTANMISV